MPLPKKSTPDAPPCAAPPLERILAELPRPVGLLGFGEEGRATLAFLKGHGVTDAAVFDRATSLGDESEAALLEGVPLHSGERYDQQLSDCGTVFRSPGVRPDLPGLERARRGGVRITSATRLFLEACPARTVGVTGTVGKGTTVTLIGEALGAADIPHRLGGNLGTNPLAFLDELTPAHVAVLELSSFQLMDLEGHWPDVAVVLRTTSEHLDWHRDVREYRRAKARILAPPEAGQRAVYCADSPGSRWSRRAIKPSSQLDRSRGPGGRHGGWAARSLRPGRSRAAGSVGTDRLAGTFQQRERRRRAAGRRIPRRVG